jgi:predicted nucleotidyltransferase
MGGSVLIEIPGDKIEEFCRRWKVTEFSLFGSVLRDDFRPDSDVDVLVSFSPDAHWRYYHILDMKDELKEIFGRGVDVIEKRLVEKSDNYIRRKHILSNLETVYVA